uniref:Ribonuclease H-like domain-containing protein n=1 Tax=Tanacetum cinerariifolium TaxID=118510 RepID=A0A6L2KI79_TANCI|nr:ribonuclease H-like domain-containing protein [Tanacetum cinerariifolium]
MVTRFRVGTNRPNERLNLHVSSVSPLPKSNREAFNDVNWHPGIRDEYNALVKNSTWTLVPRPPDVNVVRCMWLFRHTYLVDDTLSHYRARLVANGSTQLEGVDVDETFSLVVKPGTIRSLATSRHWLVHQLDEFAMAVLGSLNYFLGISVTRDSLGMFLSQKKYAVEILERASMVNYNPSRTPVDIESKLGTTGDVVSDLTLYRSLAGSLQYLTFTRPDISYVVQQIMVCSYSPLLLPTWWLIQMQIGLVAVLLDDRLQVTVSFLANNLLSWSAKRQPTLSLSSAEAE